MRSSQSIFHITHVDNLARMIASSGLYSDSAIAGLGGASMVIGMNELKGRRFDIGVPCYPGLAVADFVPFYFCPRSVMLYVIYQANHPALTYRGGQRPIVHLRADVHRVLEWAAATGNEWAFTLQNATAGYAQFRNRYDDLDEIDWSAVDAVDWRQSYVKESKQAEFLLREHMPFELIEEIGVYDLPTFEKVKIALGSGPFAPAVTVRREWYY